MHYSINAAAEILERQRRTLRRALAHVEPDSHERGQPRWRLPVIIQALQGTGAPLVQPRPASGDGDDRLEQECRATFAKFDKAVIELGRLPELEERRARAAELGGLAAAGVAAMRRRDEAAGLHEQHILLRGQEVFRLSLWGLLAPCQWSKDELWACVVSRTADEGAER
jgi:hypothetical protein